MNTKTKHTPLHWVKRMSTRQIGTFEICTAEPEPTTIALLPCDKEKNFGGHATKDEAEANAEMICKAVNNHDKLVDMLSSLVWLMTDDETGEIYEDYKLLPESTMKNSKKLLESLK